MERTGYGGWIFVVTVMLMALSHPAGRAAAAGIAVVAPREGSTLTEPAVRIAGKVDGGTSVASTVNGSPGPRVPVEGGRFSLPVTLRPGTNRISLQSPGARLDLTLEYSGGAGAAGYRFHDVYEDCAGCHDGLSSRESRRNSELCHSCHDRKDAARLLHGPVAAGQCTFCHDPHGSSYPSLTTAPGRTLCVACHDQPSSMEHQSSSGANCEKCHNPHGSEKKFFLR